LLGTFAGHEKSEASAALEGDAERVDQHVMALARDQPRGDAKRNIVRAELEQATLRRAHAVGRGERIWIDAVAHDSDSIRRCEVPRAQEGCDVLRDGDATEGEPTGEPAGAPVGLAVIEGRCAVHRRHCGNARNARRKQPVYVGVYEVCVHHVGPVPSDLGHQPPQERGADVETCSTHADIDVSAAEFVDEAVASLHLEHAHPHVDAAGRKRGKQCEQMTFGAADTFHTLDMKDAHAVSWMP
jgi:hypothetical protein